MNEPKIVVIVDDDEDDRLFLSEALLNADPEISIIEAKTGLEVIHILETKAIPDTPALIVMDMNMPFMNGIDALKEIKKIPGVEQIPVVMLSTASDRLWAQSSVRAGFKDYFVKPHHIAEYFNLAATLRDTYLTNQTSVLSKS